MNTDDRIAYSGQEASPQKPLSRREFVRLLTTLAAGGGIAAAGLGALTPSQMAEAAEVITARIGKLPKMKLGERMGNMKVSRILISSDWNPALYGPGLAVGANFVHKAGYWNSLPPEFRKIPREAYYTDITVDSTPNNPDNEDEAYNQVVGSLQRNGLGYYDIFRAHFGWRSVDAFKHQTGTYRAFKRLKRERKVRFFGVSQHATPGDSNYPAYPDIIQAEIDSGLIDSMQVWFSASTTPEITEVFARAHKAGIGMTAMKTYAQGAGAMRANPDLQRKLGAEGSIGRACIRYSLSKTSPISGKNPIFHCCVSALTNMGMFDENMSALIKMA